MFQEDWVHGKTGACGFERPFSSEGEEMRDEVSPVMSLLQPQVCLPRWEVQTGPQVWPVAAVLSWSTAATPSLSTWWTGAGAAARDGLTWGVLPGEVKHHSRILGIGQTVLNVPNVAVCCSSDWRAAPRSRVRGEVTVGQLSPQSDWGEELTRLREAREPRLGRQVPANPPGEAGRGDVH